MITQYEIIETARDWLDTPFHHQGRAKGVGVDCIGLAVGVLRELGIESPDLPGYSREPDGVLEKMLDKHLTRISIQSGALLLFKIRRNPQHVAIATEGGYMIHSLYAGKNRQSKVSEIPIDQWWSDRIIRAYALPGVTYVA